MGEHVRVHNLANITLRPPTSWGSVFGLVLVSSASMHAGWFTYDHIRMRIRMGHGRFMFDGVSNFKFSLFYVIDSDTGSIVTVPGPGSEQCVCVSGLETPRLCVRIKFVCVLLLQDLLQSCSRGGEESGGHVL